jgi:copper chaperone CopZ
MNTIDLQVSGMTCISCVASVTRAMQRVPGVTGINVDLATGHAQVQASAEAGARHSVIDALVAALEAAGYAATPGGQGTGVLATGVAAPGCGGANSQAGPRAGACCCGR